MALGYTDTDKLTFEVDGEKYTRASKTKVVYVSETTGKAIFVKALEGDNKNYTSADIVDITDYCDYNNTYLNSSQTLLTPSGNGYLIVPENEPVTANEVKIDKNGFYDFDFVPDNSSFFGGSNDEEDLENTNSYNVKFTFQTKKRVDKDSLKNDIVVEEKSYYLTDTSSEALKELLSKDFNESTYIEFNADGEEIVGEGIEKATEYIYTWYRGKNLFDLHPFMSSGTTEVNDTTAKGAMKEALSCGISVNSDNTLSIDTDIVKNEIIACRVYSNTNGYIGSSYIQL